MDFKNLPAGPPFGPLPGLTLAFLLTLTNGTAVASELTGSIATLEMEGAWASGLSWTLRPGPDGSSLRLRVARVLVADSADPVEDIELACPQFRLSASGHRCADARLDFRYLGQNLNAQLGWELVGSQLDVIAAAEVLDGRAKIHLRLNETVERLSVSARELSLAQLLAYLPAEGQQSLAVSDGTLSLDGSVDRDAAGAGQVQLSFALADLSFDSSDGTRAGAGLRMTGEAQIETGVQPVVVRSKLVLESGEALFAPVYLQLDDLPPVSLESEVRVSADGVLTVPSFNFGDGESLTIAGSAEIDAEGVVQTLIAQIVQLELPLAFDRFLLSALDSFGLGGLRPSGVVGGAIELKAGELAHASITLEGFGVEDEKQRYLLDNANGVFDYDAVGDSLDSSVSWDRIGYYALGIRASAARFFIGGREFQLLEPLFAPVLDGGLQLNELAISDFGLETLSLDFQGRIEPISLELITRALDWPVLTGTLSGDIPRVRLKGGVGLVGGAIRLDVFDGQVTVDQVKLERLFGVLPTLAAEVEILGVDLEQMTGAFSFGKITGRMDGSVRGLRLLGWQPVAFDLVLETPDRYRGKRKISQRAVENLSSLGGGAAALSHTFLRFFESFSYRRLGLKCRLFDNVCQMSGLSPAGRGFYIVEGAGIPRINIIGFSTQVDWPQLIRRLEAATSSSGPTFD